MVRILKEFEAFTLEEMVELGNSWRLEHFPNSEYRWLDVTIEEASIFSDACRYVGEMEVTANVREVHEV